MTHLIPSKLKRKEMIRMPLEFQKTIQDLQLVSVNSLQLNRVKTSKYGTYKKVQ